MKTQHKDDPFRGAFWLSLGLAALSLLLLIAGAR